MSSDRKRIPDPPAPVATTGNLLSNVAPPVQLPNFVTAAADPISTSQGTPVAHPVPVQPVVIQQPMATDEQEAENFCPAIPPSKGQPLMSIRSPEDSQDIPTPESIPEASPEMETFGDVMPGTGLLTWVKGAVASGGILHRVAEKAKSSVDTMITTLDPQMKEYLKSGGDLYIVVASDKDVKISPVREAFQTVFGKATVVGFPAQSDVTAAQPVGYAAAFAAAKQRLADLRSKHSNITNNVPLVAVESFLHEAIADRWYEISLVMLSQPSLGIEVSVQSQGTPVPSAAVSAASAATADRYQHAQTGYSLTIGSIMADSLQIPHTQWQEVSTGVARREILLLAAKSLAGLYKRLLAVSAAET